MAQLSQSGRVVTLVAVSRGNVYTAQPGDVAWTTPTNTTGDDPPLNFTGVVFSAVNNQKLYFADGVNWVRFDPLINTVERWSASAGALPVDSQNNTPRLICTWRGRTVLSGLLYDPQNWFMSRIGDPTDFDYAPTLTSPDQAVAGNNAPQGFVGDIITSLIPYSDDVLVFGGDHSIYTMSGDPLAGGQIDLVSDTIGMAWGMPWAKDPYGNLFFVSNRMGIYTMVPGQQPQRISQQIDQELQPVNTGTKSIRLAWDDRFQGLHVFVTTLANPAAETHWFWEARAQAWWKQTFGNDDHNPIAVCNFDGNRPDDRAILIGSWDGYVRTFDEDATDDDGTAISSSVVIGPLNTKNMDEILCKELQAVLATGSGSVTYSVYVGATAEGALSSTAVQSGTWQAGRNLSNLVRRAGHAVYVKITSTNQWAMEQVRCLIQTLGKVRRRGH